MAVPFAAIGSAVGAGLNFLRNNKTDKLQKDFAQKGIQWKVKDAVKAGIHPLYALGANTVSYSPTTVGDMSANLSDMGQNIDRARMASSELPARGVSAVMEKLALERAGLENDLLRSQIRKTNAPAVGPAMPSIPIVDAPRVQSGPFNMGGANLNVPSGLTSAQTWQDFGGEMAEWYGGIQNLDKLIQANPRVWLDWHSVPRDKPRFVRGPYRR